MTREEVDASFREAAESINQEVAAKPRGPLAQAQNQVAELKELCASCAGELEQVSTIRAGLMDSDQRRAEVQRQIQQVLARVAQRLRRGA